MPQDIFLVTSNQDSIWTKLVFRAWSFLTFAEDSSARVVSRSEWGADESIRYMSASYREKTKQDWILRGKAPKVIEETETQKKNREDSESQFHSIELLHPDSTKIVSIKRYEWNNKLIWPIIKTKKVEKIVVHHTAESLDQDADDMTLLRAIYLYHARSRGWGDIGYNYVIGQRGTIYEGRYGGDYVEWAHVYWNNAGTAGISVIGNYSDLHLNKDQKAWLINAITMVAQKYGIDISLTYPGAHVCKWDVSCNWELVYTPWLIGHRDLASTGCPWDNLYEILPELRNAVMGKVWKVSPIYNTTIWTIDPLDPEDITLHTLKSSSTSSTSSTATTIIKPVPLLNLPKSSDLQVPPTRSAGGKPIKIRLSYPGDTLLLESATKKIANVKIGTKKAPFKKWELLNIALNGKTGLVIKVWEKQYQASEISFSSDIVRISSWSRVPLWDTNKRYNDNLFRNTIIVKNNQGKLLVINQLPIEDYVKWLWEVSNSDLPEKIKTILVAARSYAYYYADASHRKYNTNLYDGSDDPNEFQKYLWYSLELRSPDIAKLADLTRREVITYRGELIKPWYFTSSDGKTRSFLEYCTSNGWKNCQDIPYLQSVDDPAWAWRERQWHGVGISGIGASYGASMWKTYKEIIAYYLKGVEIIKK